MFYKIFYILAITALCATACVKSHRVQRTFATPAQGWASADEKTFTFYINDTAQQYNLILLLQHSYNYNFSNIWLNVSTTMPSGKVLQQKQEIPLAFADGRWMGRSAAGVCLQELNLGPDGGALKFNQVGLYTIKYKQIMRENPLQDVQQVGMALERLPYQQH